jgi:hypothetical protein
MEKLQWFKFSPTDWVMGKIQRCPEITQARYLRLVCLYWNKEGVLSYEDAEIEIDKEHLDLLIAKKVIKTEDGFIIIDFMNEQLGDIAKTSQKRKEAVTQRWNKLKDSKLKELQDNTIEIQNDTNEIQTDTSVLQNDTNEIQNDTEKRRVEESRVDKRKSILFIKPSVNEVIAYFEEKGYKKEIAEKAFNYYDSADWKDSKGNKVKNWKQKMNGNWFKDEYKFTPQTNRVVEHSSYYINSEGKRISKLAF